MSNIFSAVSNLNLCEAVNTVAGQVSQLQEIAKTKEPDQSVIDQVHDMISLLSTKVDNRLEQFAA